MGIKPVDFIGEKKGALGSHALTKKGLRQKQELPTMPIRIPRKSCPDEEGIETKAGATDNANTDTSEVMP